MSLPGPAAADAQGLPQAPVTWLGGRLLLSGSVSASVGSGESDDSFNPGDYGQDTMRLVEVSISSTATPHRRAFLVGDLRAAGSYDGSDWYLRPSSLLAGARPLPWQSFVVTAGLMQSPFGRSGRAGYGRENLLVGLPLIYQYPSTLRATPFRYSIDGMLSMRGTGGRGFYGYGAYEESVGLPLVDPRGWNAGIGVAAGSERVRASAAVTRGSISNPLSRGEDGGWQVSGRLEARPLLGLVLGASSARGTYARGAAAGAYSSSSSRGLMETAYGIDAEYSRGYWLLRGEVVHSRREVSIAGGGPAPGTLGATGVDVEGRYRLAPGFYVAARFGRLSFGSVRGTLATLPWDAGVTRVEGGFGWSPSRPLLLKVAYQYNRRPDGVGPHLLQRAAMQALVWF